MTAEKQTDLYVSWDEYHKKIEELAIKVYQDGYDFSQIVCIAKGGLRVGDIFARLFDKPLAILSVESYRGDGVKNEQGSMTFSRDLAQTTPEPEAGRSLWMICRTQASLWKKACG